MQEERGDAHGNAQYTDRDRRIDQCVTTLLDLATDERDEVIGIVRLVQYLCGGDQDENRWPNRLMWAQALLEVLYDRKHSSHAIPAELSQQLQSRRRIDQCVTTLLDLATDERDEAINTILWSQGFDACSRPTPAAEALRSGNGKGQHALSTGVAGEMMPKLHQRSFLQVVAMHVTQAAEEIGLPSLLPPAVWARYRLRPGPGQWGTALEWVLSQMEQQINPDKKESGEIDEWTAWNEFIRDTCLFSHTFAEAFEEGDSIALRRWRRRLKTIVELLSGGDNVLLLERGADLATASLLALAIRSSRSLRHLCQRIVLSSWSKVRYTS